MINFIYVFYNRAIKTNKTKGDFIDTFYSL